MTKGRPAPAAVRRWNGWGLVGTEYPVPPGAARFLAGRITAHVIAGKGDDTESRRSPLDESGAPLPEPDHDQVARAIPPSRLPWHPAVSTDPSLRLSHALGQSLPDWIRLRAGQIPVAPDGVAFPTDDEEVRGLLAYAREAGAAVIPYGGGTSVVGQLEIARDLGRPVLSVDTGKMEALHSLDATGHLATFGAGAKGPDIEAELGGRGFTLGHFPQSFELSSIGGWVATRSAGQESLLYGRIEDLFAGGRVETPAGTLVLPATPASAAGPDLRQLVLGSEGRLGVLTEAVVRIRPAPTVNMYGAAFFPDFDSGLAALREIAQGGGGGGAGGGRGGGIGGGSLCLLRLDSAEETATTLALAGHGRLIRQYERWLAWRGATQGKCLLIFGAAGGRRPVRRTMGEVFDACRAHRAVGAVTLLAREWVKNRFRTPYLRNTLWEMGYAVDTLETAVTWSKVGSLLSHLEVTLSHALADKGEGVHAFAHISHVYRDGANIYVTYIFRRGWSPAESLRRWKTVKEAACRIIVEAGGTISHQHGVGLDHKAYLAAEKGELGLAALRGALGVFDPAGMMNPGKLV